MHIPCLALRIIRLSQTPTGQKLITRLVHARLEHESRNFCRSLDQERPSSPFSDYHKFLGIGLGHHFGDAGERRQIQICLMAPNLNLTPPATVAEVVTRRKWLIVNISAMGLPSSISLLIFLGLDPLQASVIHRNKNELTILKK